MLIVVPVLIFVALVIVGAGIVPQRPSGLLNALAVIPIRSSRA
jgi:hypothetical protein